MMDRVIVSKAHTDPWDPKGFRAFAFDTETGERAVGTGDTAEQACQDAGAKALGKVYAHVRQVAIVKPGETVMLELRCAIRPNDFDRIHTQIAQQSPGLSFVLLPNGVVVAKVET